MKAFILVLFMSYFSNGFPMASKRPEPLPVPPPVQKPVKEELPAKSEGFNVTFKALDFYSTPKEREIIKAAEGKIKEVVNSKCFQEFITSTRLEETQGKSNLDVYLHILGMSGEIPVKMYLRRFTSAVAYRQPPSLEINLNRNFFTASVPVCSWAATMAHEALGHSLGNYEHSFKWSVEREYSVPYKLGGAMEKHGGNAFSRCCK
jgi:hypothetical protein